MDAIPVEAWAGLAGVLVGSLLTTFGVWLTNRANLKQVRLQLAHGEQSFRQRRTKKRLEELYILVCHWQHGLFTNYLNLTLVMKGQADYNWYHDQIIAMSPTVDFNRLEMIIWVYAPDLKEIYNTAIGARSAVNEIEFRHRCAYKNGETGEPFLQAFTNAERKLEDGCEALKKAVAESARTT